MGKKKWCFGREDVICITGSFYLAAEAIRQHSGLVAETVEAE